MSHFVVLVVVPPGRGWAAAEKLLAPFDENLETSSSFEECYCVGREAIDAGHAAAEAEHGSFEDLRRAFFEREDVKALAAGGRSEDEKVRLETASQQGALWCEHIAAYEATEQREIAAHPMAGKPDPECDDCDGTGETLRTSNPHARWDWYQLGGRWSGWLTEYDPEQDPRNKETCSGCGGTGKRDGDAGEKVTCNPCDGTGQSTKWPTQWAAHDGNQMRVADIPADKAPYAILTPDGEWHEKGTMDWFGISSGEKDDWDQEARGVLADYPEHTAYTVDCHI